MDIQKFINKIKFDIFQVLSDGRSLLPSDFQVMVKPEVENVASILENKFKNIGALLTQDLLNMWGFFFESSIFTIEKYLITENF